MGQVRLVRDRDGDGQFDASTVFLDGIPFPTGVTSWKRGVLVCSAPDILYAEDTDGDDRADSVTKLFTGFGTLNMQARVNSLNYGLDGWIYGSCGLFGGTITNSRGQSFALGDRDFRFHPETLELQPATGRTQQGRVRDDFGNWFGCDNSNLGFHYPLAEHYLQRNPFIAAPANRLNVARSDESRQLFPARTDAQRFQLSGAPGSVTAACGIGVYRDSKLGAEYANNLFVCEPVNLLVHRMKLKRQGVSFEAERPDNEAGTEFLRSTDGWFRPVQVVTGPDGNLWVVDMYRFLIEDPRWIPEHELAPLDVRAGTTLGRIYRVRNRDDQSTPVAHRVPRETGKTASSDVLSLTRPNPYPVHHERTLARLAARAKSPDEQLIAAAGALRLPPTLPEDAVLRIGKYRTAEASGLLTEDNIRKALTDLHEGIRSYALQLTERHLTAESLPDEIIKTCSDPEISVRLQAACSLGHWTDQRVGPLLAELALHDADNSYVVAAVFSSVTRDNLRAFTATLFAKLKGREPPAAIMTPYLATAVGYGDDEAIKLGLAAVTVTPGQPLQAWQLQGIANLVEALSQRPDQTAIDRDVTRIIREMEDRARTLVAADDLADQTRLAAINLLGRNALQTKADTTELSRLLSSRFAPAVQVAAVEALERMGDDSVPALLAAQFSSVSPATQTRIIDALLSRDAWYPTLFTEIEAGNLPATAFNAAQRQELVGHPDEATRTRAAKLFATLVNADRQRVIQQYQEALTLRGDAERGRALFTKTCAQCHRLGEVGHAVGPNLSMVANKTPAFLLQELMDPNRNVDSRYVSYAAETKRGLVRTGILSSESTNSVTLLGPEGKQYTLLRSEIEDLRATGRSLMPEGLERDLMPQSVADIIAFLTSVPATPKVFAGNHPATVTPADKEVALLATTAAIFGDQIVYEAPFRNVGFWHGVQDHVAWSLELPERREYDVYMDYACDAGSAGNSYRIESGTESLAGRIEPTGGWDRYTVAKVGQLKLNEGKQRVVLRPDGASIRGALVDLRGLHLVPAGEPFAMALPAETAEPTTVAEIAQQIMDDNRPEATRQQLITRHPEQAAALVTAMTSDLANDEDEEYRRIPWIWRVAIACGKRNDAAQIRALLDVSVPKRNHQLRDWQAVVLGGGIINGLSLQRQWPAVRLNEIVRDDADLKQRLARCIALASQMADNDKIRTGTRYDALRIIALENEPGRRTQLTDYLLEEVNDELQMGAISGLSDIQSNDVAQLLLGHLANFNDENRGLALSALLRTDQRATELLEAIARDKALASKLSVEHRKTLRQSANAAISERAKQLLAD